MVLTSLWAVIGCGQVHASPILNVQCCVAFLFAGGESFSFISSTDAVGYREAFYGEGVGEIAFDRLVCDGTEPNIGECLSLSNPPFFGPCQHSNDASVACYPDSKWS